ncbi:metal ABC transporter ATP-binding protein [Comamonas antarctica]|nr:metal ABC transporter ATP-binding protein [Comamonas antarctica]
MMRMDRMEPLQPAQAGADLSLDRVSLGYGARLAVQDLSGHFARGSMTAVIGPNGGGKSTLLKGLLGLLRPLRGSIASRHPRPALGYLPQAGGVDPQFPVSVEDFVAVGLWPRIGAFGRVTPPLAERVRAAIAAVGLQGLQAHYIGELSGGQFQRMRFARLLVQDPPVVLLDEPLAGVDEATAQALLQLLQDWHVQGKTVIAVLHERERVRSHFPQTLALAGRMRGWGETRAVLEALEDAEWPR